MKKLIVSIALLSASMLTSANNFSMPGFNNGNGFNNGSSWTMPNMNFGNSTNGNNGFNNGSNWSMPNMNWGNSNNSNNTNGNNWSMPAMNWGNSNNGYNNGSNWNIPNMNWGNSNNNGNGFTNGSNWTMPNMNWGNGNNQPWNFGNNINNGNNSANYAPNVQYRAPAMPVAPQFIPRLNTQNTVQAPVAKKPVVKAATQKPAVTTAPATQAKIPMPSEVKGTILAPANKTPKIEGTK